MEKLISLYYIFHNAVHGIVAPKIAHICADIFIVCILFLVLFSTIFLFSHYFKVTLVSVQKLIKLVILYINIFIFQGIAESFSGVLVIPFSLMEHTQRKFQNPFSSLSKNDSTSLGNLIHIGKGSSRCHG